jgi:hypothetical protein
MITLFSNCKYVKLEIWAFVFTLPIWWVYEAPSWLITVFVTRVTRQVPPVEQELFTPAGAPAFTLGFSGVRVACYYSFICMFCRSLFVPFLLFLLTILLPVLLRFTDSAYPLDIFKSSYTHHIGRVKTKAQISSLTYLQLLNNVIIIWCVWFLDHINKEKPKCLL